MSDAKKPADAPASDKGKKAKGPSKLVPILVGVNSLVMLGVMGVLAMQLLKKPAHADAEPAASKGAEHAEASEKKEAGEEHGSGEKKEAKTAGGEHGEAGGEKKAAAGSGSAGTAMGPLVKVSDFVVHLRNPEVDRYARISFDVEVINDSDKDALNQSMSKVRDAFISYLSDRSVEELRGSDGLARTKDALQTKLHELVPDTRVRALYISDFVIQ